MIILIGLYGAACVFSSSITWTWTTAGGLFAVEVIGSIISYFMRT